jgi:hypothetical protein
VIFIVFVAPPLACAERIASGANATATMRTNTEGQPASMISSP